MFRAWYVASSSDELTGKPLARILLDKPVVLFREADGTPVALEDRCPHRFLPLSKGTVTEAGLRCDYHGLVFDRSGSCVKAATQEDVPARARVSSYPLVERYGFAWIWLGEPELADPQTIPNFDVDVGLEHHSSEQWAAASGYYRAEASYLLVLDNLMDLSHITLVHPTTLAAGGFNGATSRVESAPGSVSDYRVAYNIDAGLGYGPLFGGATTKIDYWLDMHWKAPSTFLLDAYLTVAGEDKNRGIRNIASQLITPETDTSCHYYWVSSRNFQMDDEQLTCDWAKMVGAAFDEDAEILKEQQKSIGERDILDMQPAVLRADKSGLLARRQIQKLLKSEQIAS